MSLWIPVGNETLARFFPGAFWYSPDAFGKIFMQEKKENLIFQVAQKGCLFKEKFQIGCSVQTQINNQQVKVLVSCVEGGAVTLGCGSEGCSCGSEGCGCSSEGCGCGSEGCGCGSEGCGCGSEGCGCGSEGCGCGSEGCGCGSEGCGCGSEGCGCGSEG